MIPWNACHSHIIVGKETRAETEGRVTRVVFLHCTELLLHLHLRVVWVGCDDPLNLLCREAKILSNVLPLVTKSQEEVTKFW